MQLNLPTLPPETSRNLVKALLLVGVFTGVILFFGYAAYNHGYRQGTNEVWLEWEVSKEAARAVQDELIARVAKQEERHRLEQEELSNDLVRTRELHETVLAHQRASYEHRLLQSSRRAEAYLRQAEAGIAAQRDLASHTAQLDRALEEGRGLVTELGFTLRLRDYQLKKLGEQLLNDRQIFSGEERR
jgi:hypothetical protein